jgi:hypothetical protein
MVGVSVVRQEKSEREAAVARGFPLFCEQAYAGRLLEGGPAPFLYALSKPRVLTWLG